MSMAVRPSICGRGVDVPAGVTALGVAVRRMTGEGVGDFCPTRVGVKVKVAVGRMGRAVAVGLGVLLAVEVGGGCKAGMTPIQSESEKLQPLVKAPAKTRARILSETSRVWRR